MRLGAQECLLNKESLAYKMYRDPVVRERHRHRYEVNGQYISRMEESGMIVSGVNGDTNLVEMIEVPSVDWFVACQFHPEFRSSPRDGHPLFTGFIEAAVNYAANR